MMESPTLAAYCKYLGIANIASIANSKEYLILTQAAKNEINLVSREDGDATKFYNDQRSQGNQRTIK